MFSFGQRAWGPGMIILQILRVFTIISLLTAGASFWILIIKIDTSSGWFFFEAVSLAMASSATIFLIISELPFCKTYFTNNWPTFSDEHGLMCLGVGLIFIGANLLGKLNMVQYGYKDLGLPFWRLIVAAGILTLTFGVINLICTLIFHGGNVNARKIRANGSLAADEESFGKPKSNYSASLANEDQPKFAFKRRFWEKRGEPSGDGRRGLGVGVGRLNISQPITHDRDLERNAPPPPHYEHQEPSFTSRPSHDSGEDRRSPIVPEVRRPDTALHPMNIRPHSPSMYSEAHMSRF
ncbi:hypothetical protein FBEOM_3065 [Fusarium beomiforme]|uniref:DUF7598 domain-containing protein n=1 Tax=Fusarium beomiforme TaxID=44412 RepID=A0A9P5AQA6_9HYPO|nr:hypothetical protein FBEOM_3065 [Fusarium beomiforme]